jgi:hypothetical protein
MKQIITLYCIATATTSFAASLSPMQEGLWEITSHTEIPGRKAPQPQPVTSRACYTLQDVEQENAAAPKDDRCEIRNYQHTGNKATWEITCAGKENITGHGSVTFDGRIAYRGTVALTMTLEGQSEIQMNNNYSGKRLGNCEQ